MDRKKLLWMDLEMTGLEPKTDRIVEVACVVTDYNFKELGVYEAVINQPAKLIDPLFAANEWWLKDSAEYKKLREHMAEGITESKVIEGLSAFITEHFPKGGAVLAGNSIHQDRRFIRAWWPQVEELLHYRMLDVTSFKLIMENKFRLTLPKAEKHRALADVRESIEELKTYLDRGMGRKK